VERIRTSRRLQKEVDKHAAEDVAKVAAVVIWAGEYQNGLTMEAFEDGMNTAAQLQRIFERRNTQAPVGIWRATKAGWDGDNMVFFVGVLSNTLAKLRKLPNTQAL